MGDQFRGVLGEAAAAAAADVAGRRNVGMVRGRQVGV